MKIGTVMGKLDAKRCAPGFEGCWVQVRLEGKTLVAADPVGVKAGQTVLIAEGETAGRYFMDLCADAVVAAVLTENGNNG